MFAYYGTILLMRLEGGAFDTLAHTYGSIATLQRVVPLDALTLSLRSFRLRLRSKRMGVICIGSFILDQLYCDTSMWVVPPLVPRSAHHFLLRKKIYYVNSATQVALRLGNSSDPIQMTNINDQYK